MKARTFIMIVLFNMIIEQSILMAQSPLMIPSADTSTAKASKKRTRSMSKSASRKPSNHEHFHKVYTDMTFDELEAAIAKKLKSGDKEIACKYYEQLLKISTDVNKTAEIMLAYADLLFELGELKKALAIYNEFMHLYPGHERYKYAYKRSVLASFYLTLSADRDQTMTEETIRLTKGFLDVETDQQIRQEVTDIQKQCYKKMVDSELGICDFYLKQGSLKAVEQRLAHVKTEYLPYIPDAEAEILAMELELSKHKDQIQVVAAHAGKENHASKRF